MATLQPIASGVVLLLVLSTLLALWRVRRAERGAFWISFGLELFHYLRAGLALWLVLFLLAVVASRFR